MLKRLDQVRASLVFEALGSVMNPLLGRPCSLSRQRHLVTVAGQSIGMKRQGTINLEEQSFKCFDRSSR
jgi:hypothetical protein